jgi:hypothetical protein
MPKQCRNYEGRGAILRGGGGGHWGGSGAQTPLHSRSREGGGPRRGLRPGWRTTQWVGYNPPSRNPPTRANPHNPHPAAHRPQQAGYRRNRRRGPMPRLRSRSLLAQPPGPESAASKCAQKRGPDNRGFQARAAAPCTRRSGDRRYIPCSTRGNRRRGAPPRAARGARIPTGQNQRRTQTPIQKAPPEPEPTHTCAILTPHPARRPTAAARRGAPLARCVQRTSGAGADPRRQRRPPQSFMHRPAAPHSPAPSALPRAHPNAAAARRR